MKNTSKVMTTSILALTFMLGGCARNISPNTYTGNDVGIVSIVKPGIIISKRAVTINNDTGIGMLSGATAGGAAGSMIGGNTATNVVGAVGGVVVGGAVGNAIDKTINTHQGYEYIIKLDAGPTISVVQEQQLQFNVNQHVLVIYGEMTRIIADDTQTAKTKPATKNAKK